MRNLSPLVAFRLVASEEKGGKVGGAKTKKYGGELRNSCCIASMEKKNLKESENSTNYCLLE